MNPRLMWFFTVDVGWGGRGCLPTTQASCGLARETPGIVSRFAACADFLNPEGLRVACASGALICMPVSTYRAMGCNAHLASGRDARTDGAALGTAERGPGGHTVVTASLQ